MQPAASPPDTLLLTANEFATAARIGRTLAYQLIRTRQVPVVRIGRLVRIPRKALEEWLEGQTQ